MTFFDYFQIAIIAIVIAIIFTKAAYLRISRNITAIVAGRDSRGLARVFEIAAFAGLVFWMVEVLSYALHSSVRILPAAFHYQLFDSFPAKSRRSALDKWRFDRLHFRFLQLRRFVARRR